jgi:uncharacterized protein
VGAAPAALVMARAPRPGACKTRLEPLLGAEGCARLQAVLIRRAAAWAAHAAPGRAFVAFDPPDALEEVAPLVPAGTDLLAQAGGHLGERLAAAVERVFALAGGGPLLVAGTDVPRLSGAHAEAALTDLANGCDASFGPALDGGYYLAALAAPHPELFGLRQDAWGGPTVLARTLEIAREHGLELGLLRYERDLDTPLDARALLADPLSPPDVVAALRP